MRKIPATTGHVWDKKYQRLGKITNVRYNCGYAHWILYIKWDQLNDGSGNTIDLVNEYRSDTYLNIEKDFEYLHTTLTDKEKLVFIFKK